MSDYPQPADECFVDEEFEARLERLLHCMQLVGDARTAILLRWHEQRQSWYFQIERWREDAFTGLLGMGRGGKYYVAPHMIDSEIVQGVWGLYQNYVIHEAREAFRYKGVAIYGPHIDIEALVTAGQQIAVRPPQA